MISNEVARSLETPTTYTQAMDSTQSEIWIHACNEKMNSMKKLKVYNLVDIPKLRKHIDTRCVFKVNENEVGNITR